MPLPPLKGIGPFPFFYVLAITVLAKSKPNTGTAEFGVYVCVSALGRGLCINISRKNLK